MFYLHLSNRTENLLRQLAEVLRLDEQRDPFSPEYFLVQSQGMERMLSQYLAEQFGVWCNYEYVLPTRFFARMAERLGMVDGTEDFSRDTLCWYLESALRTVVQSDDGCFAPLKRYVGGDDSGVKRYQLARQLANVFDQYQIMRPGMLDGWEKGRRATDNPAEPWQMALWKMVCASIGHSRHRGMFLRELILLLERDADYSALLPKRLSVFGLHSMPPILLHCLRALSKHCDLQFYLLAPCENYVGDQTGLRAALRNSISPGDVSGTGQDPGLAGHPLLLSLGQQGREFQEMLLDDVPLAGEFPSFEEPLDEEQPSLLHRLQSDLLHGALRSGEASLSADGSITVVSAHSPHREMMILKDRILLWLDENPDLALRDIIVMAPDIQVYSGLIPAVFHDIPHSVADRNPAFSNRYLAVFIQFLELVSSRFGWTEVLDLLGRDEVYPRFDIHETDLDTIRHWVLASGIRWGLSASQKESAGLPGRAECTWRSGLERLMMGYACSTEKEVDGVVPYPDIEGAMAAPLGGLSLFCELLEDAGEQFRVARSLAAWSEILGGFVTRLFGDDNADALAELHGILADLGLQYEGVHREKVSFEVIRSWVEAAVEGKRSSSGFLRGQLTFCSMLPMRSIPFARVCLLGLNDSVFPESDFHPPFDLLGDSFLPGDRSRRNDDRYQFLEAILSARESFYLSYVGQSIRSNDPIPPSVVLSELTEFLEFYGVRKLTEVHPLHGFSASYYEEEGNLFSYNSGLMAVAASLRSEVPATSWWRDALPVPKVTAVAVPDFFSFFRNPQSYLIRQVMGIYCGSDIDSKEEHEPFELDGLQSYLFDQELLAAELQGVSADFLLRRSQVSGRWPLGGPGRIRFNEKREELREFIARVRTGVAAGKEEDRMLAADFCGLSLSGRMGDYYEGGTFLFRYAGMKGKDLLAAWVHHCLTAVCFGDTRETRLLARDMEIVFPGDSGGREDLEFLADLFSRGQRQPSWLMVEPAFAYARQREKTEKSGRGDPLTKARNCAEEILVKGMDSHWDLLYQGRDPDEFLGPQFAELCDWVYESLWKRAHVKNI